MKRIAAILNDTAGKRKRPERFQEARKALESPDIAATVMVTRGQGVPQAAASAAREYDVVAAGGGDGTLNAVASELVGSDAALGVLPLGTLNHFALDIGIPFDPKEAANALRNGRTALIDIGEVGGHYFLNNSSVGVYPWLVKARTHMEGAGMGRLRAMIASASLILFGMPVFRVTMRYGDKEVVRTTPFVFVGNNRYEMESLNAWKRGAFDEGILTVCVLHGKGRLAFVKLAVAALFGRLRMTEDFDVVGLTELTIDAPVRVADVALDGEVREIPTPLRYRIRPKALKIMLPNGK